tara:strand:- start:460 stop:1119 length:660 start_codon:yes stop_codon:yes gene_type:complete
VSVSNNKLSWLVAYGDTVTLLICLLITIVVVLQGQSENDVEWLSDQIELIGIELENEYENSNIFSIEQRAGSVVVFLNSNSFAECKSEILKDDLKTEISKLGGELLGYIRFLENINKPYFIEDSVYTEIVIEGHTDNKPLPPNSKICTHENNWQLSSARAFETMNIITESLFKGSELYEYSKSISIRGYADKKPLCIEDTPKCRSLNRRVEIIFTARLM